MTRAALVALTLLVPCAAEAVPARLTHQGRLTGADGAPVDDVLRFVFRLYDRAEGGEPLWVEPIDVAVEGGHYAVVLGESAALPIEVFAGDDVYLDVEVDGDPLEGRLALTSVPFALRAAVADNATGDLTPRSVVIDGRTVIDPEGRWTGDPGGLQGPAGPQGPVGPQGPRGEPGVSPSAEVVRDGLAADPDFLDALGSVLASAFADALRGPIGPQGPQGTPGVPGSEGPRGPAGQDAAMPPGAVVPFALAACPVGWSAADGNAGRPDLRGRLPLGVGPRPQGGVPIGLNEGGGSHRYRVGAKANEFGCCVSDQGVGGVTFEWIGENGPAAVVPNGDSGITQFSNEVDHLPPYRGLLYCVKN